MLENDLTDQMLPKPGGTETMRCFLDEQKWISTDYKMSIPGRKNDLKETCAAVDIKPFQLMRVPVTRDLYNFVMNKEAALQGDGFPVVNVSWHDAIHFCNGLSEATGLHPCYAVDAATGQTRCD